MHPWRHVLGLVALSLVAGAAPVGCDGTETHFSLAFESAHFRYHVADGAAPPCEETKEWLERDYQAFAEFLGVPETRNVKVDYYYYASQESVRQDCGGIGTACADGSSVFSSHPVTDHELVHAIGSFVGNPPFLFQEGLADMLAGASRDVPGERRGISEPLERLTTTASFVEWTRTDGLAVYSSAAKLVRMLCDRFGTATFMAFYGSISVEASAAAVSEAARAHFGATIDSLIADARALPPTHPDENRRHVMPCHDARLVAGSQAVMPLICARAGIGSEGVVSFTAGPGPTELLFDGGAFVIELGRCTGGTLTGLPTKLLPSDSDPRGARVVLDVPAGDYYATVRATAPQMVTIQDLPSAGTLAGDPTCTPERHAIELSSDYPVILASRWRTNPCVSAPWCPGLGWDLLPMTDGQVAVTGFVDELPANLFSCQSNCPADSTPSCSTQPLAATTAPVRLPATAATPLHLGADNSPNDAFFALLLRLLPP